MRKRRNPSQQNDFNVFLEAEYFVVSKFVDHFHMLSRVEVKTLVEALELAAQHDRSLIYAVMKSGRFACMAPRQVKDFLSEIRET